MDLDWTSQLTDQLDRHWHAQLRPRLDGLTDDEYFWEPVPGCWNIRALRRPPVDYATHRYAGTAAEALGQLDAAYRAWSSGARALTAEALAVPCGPAEGPYAEVPMATLVLHINRETIHLGAEIALLRDLYLRQAR